MVIVDVMSLPTYLSLAVDNGARIYPCLWKGESANEYGRKIGAKTAILTGDSGIGHTCFPSGGDRMGWPARVGEKPRTYLYTGKN